MDRFTRAKTGTTTAAPTKKVLKPRKVAKTASPAAQPEPGTGTEVVSPVSPDEIELRIRERAYELWVLHGRRHGHATADWLQAEHEVIESITKSTERAAAKKTTRARAKER